MLTAFYFLQVSSLENLHRQFVFTGHVGAPLPCNMVKLFDAPEKDCYSKDGKGEVSTLCSVLAIERPRLWIVCSVISKGYRPEARGYVIYSSRALPEGVALGQHTRGMNHITTS